MFILRSGVSYFMLRPGARGARNAASYALYSLLRLFLSREAVENINRPDKAISPTYFNT
jgi:hypothetical protein